MTTSSIPFLRRALPGRRRRRARPPVDGRRALLVLLAIAACAFGARPARAQQEREPGGAAATDPGGVSPEARRLFEQGKQQLQARDFDGALRSFQESYAIYPAPGLLYIMGQAHRLKGDCARALAFYRQYLPVSAPERKLREKTEARIADMERCVAEQKNPPRAEAAPISTTMLPVLPPVVPAEALISKPAAPPPQVARPWRRALGLGLSTATVGLLSLGGYFAWHSSEAAGDVSDAFEGHRAWTPELAERERIGKRDESLARGFIVGGALLAGLTTWYLLR